MIPASVAALDIDEARWGISRDISEVVDAGWFGWIGLSVYFGLPLVCLALLLRRRWLAALPLIGWLALMANWFLYYATDWWSNPGQGVSMPIMGLVVLGWLIVAVESMRWLSEWQLLRQMRREGGGSTLRL